MIFYVPLAALLALINPTLGWVVAVVGAGAATVVFGIPMFMAMLPGLLIWCGGALALGGLIGLQGPGSILLGALLAVAGYIWSRAQKQ